MYSKDQTIDIKHLSTSLLDPQIEQSEIEQNINTIYEYFSSITHISEYTTEIKHLAAVPTASGMALSLHHAAQCLLDYKRTTKFLRSIVTAVLDKQKEHPNKTITIFYAGCGPYAPFATLVAPLFIPQEVQFSILEINPDALELSKKLIHTLGFQDYIKEYYLADAVTFTIPTPDSFHILFSETLDALLYRESYVPILHNMLPQLPESTIVIPKNVRIKLSFRTQHRHENTEKIIVQEDFAGNIFDTRKALKALAPATNPSFLPSVQFDLDATTHYVSLIIDTEVHIYKELWLTRGESSLTLPHEMPIDQTSKFNGIIFTYQLQPQVELRYKWYNHP